MTETALQTVEQRAASIPVKSMQDITDFGTLLERSGMFGCKQQGQGAVLVMSCLQSGKPLLDFIEEYHIVEGRPSMRADAMLAKLLELGGSYKIIERSSKKAAIEATFREASGVFELSWEDAKQEPFTKDAKGQIKKNYATPRARMQMLWARAISDAVRTVCPLACKGKYTPEEIETFDDRPASKYVAPEAVVTEPDEVIPPENKDSKHKEAKRDLDFTVMPFGKFQGKQWIDLTDAQLEKALKLSKLEDGHRDEIRKVIELRKKHEESGNE